jgi:hypothetical protein
MRTAKALLLFKAGNPTRLIPGLWSMSIAGGTAAATESPAGSLNLTGDGTNAGRGDQRFTSTINRTYTIRATSSDGNNSILIGTSQGGGQIRASTPLTAGGPDVITFKATTSNTWVRFTRTVASAGTVTQVSCR